MNDSLHELSRNPRLSADDTSLFSVLRGMNLSANALNNGLLKINNWTYHWKMSFNSDPSKQAQEVIFSQKIKRSSVNFPVLIFNNNQVLQTPYQKFGEHLRYIANKVNISIGLLRKLQKCLLR